MQAFSEAWKVPIELRSATDRLMAERVDDDQGLLRRLARGDEWAFSVIYDRYQRAIHRFAWHMTGDQTTADEITQEVFMMLIRKPNKSPTNTIRPKAHSVLTFWGSREILLGAVWNNAGRWFRWSMRHPKIVPSVASSLLTKATTY